MSSMSTAPTVAARLDRIPPIRMHRRMSVAVGFANFFDLYDIFLGRRARRRPGGVLGARHKRQGARQRPPYRRRTGMLYIFQFLQTVGYYGFGTLAPLVLADKGFDIVESLGFSAVIFLGYPVGSRCRCR